MKYPSKDFNGSFDGYFFCVTTFSTAGFSLLHKPDHEPYEQGDQRCDDVVLLGELFQSGDLSAHSDAFG